MARIEPDGARASTGRGRSGRWRWWWRAVRHPLTLPLWFAIAAAGWVTVQRQRIGGDVTLLNAGRVANEILSWVGGEQSTAWAYDLYAVDESAGWRIIDTNIQSTGDLMSVLWTDNPERVVRVDIVLETHRSGMIAFTSRRTVDRMGFVPQTGPDPNEAEREAIRRAAVDYLLLAYPDELGDEVTGRVAHLRSGDGGRDQKALAGYGVNAMLLVGGGMLMLATARSAGMAVELGRRMLARRRGRRGECPDCGYSLAGARGGVCPECGAAINAHGRGA